MNDYYNVALVVNECRVIGEYRYSKSKVTQTDFEVKYTLVLIDLFGAVR